MKRKENHLPNLHDYVQNVNLPGCNKKHRGFLLLTRPGWSIVSPVFISPEIPPVHEANFRARGEDIPAQ